MDEQDLRWRTANTYAEVHNAKERYNEMKNLYDEICSMGEIVKLLHVRIFVADPTIAGLQEKVKTTITALDSAEYKAAVFLNESKEEWLSMFQSYSKQEQGFAFLNGQPLPSFTLAGGNPFHYTIRFLLRLAHLIQLEVVPYPVVLPETFQRKREKHIYSRTVYLRLNLPCELT